MGRITGLEGIEDVPQKVRQMYQAVLDLIEEGAAVTGLRVSTITDRAGIGKGTAYEYFDTKEELVACAMVYHMQRLFVRLENVLQEQGGFREQLNFLLDEMGREDDRKYCFLRFVHILTDNSEFSRLVQQKIKSEKFERYMPTVVFGNVLKRAVDAGELRSDLPVDYMVYSVFAHLLTFMMAIVTKDDLHVDSAGMRSLVYNGILNELCKKKE